MNTAHELQKPGAIGVIPTDTVYGVVARAADIHAVARGSTGSSGASISRARWLQQTSTSLLA